MLFKETGQWVENHEHEEQHQQEPQLVRRCAKHKSFDNINDLYIPDTIDECYDNNDDVYIAMLDWLII